MERKRMNHARNTLEILYQFCHVGYGSKPQYPSELPLLAFKRDYSRIGSVKEKSTTGWFWRACCSDWGCKTRVP